MNEQRIIRALKGVAIGDAFGLGVEMKSRNWIVDHVDFTKYVNVWMGGEGKNNISPGTYSDDTEHTIGICEAMLDDNGMSVNLLLEKFKAEYINDIAKKGFPRDGHGSIKDWYNNKISIEEVRSAQASRTDPGNAPVMRSLPFCLYPIDQIPIVTHMNTWTTHPNPLAETGALMSTLACHYFIVMNGKKEGLIDFLKDQFSDNQMVLTKLNEIDQMPCLNSSLMLDSIDDYMILHGVQPLPPIPNLPAHFTYDPNVYGLPVSAFKTACTIVYLLKHINNTFDALKASILMGGDVDSLAAITVGVCSAMYGMDSLPEFLNVTEGLTRMEDLGRRLYTKFCKK